MNGNLLEPMQSDMVQRALSLEAGKGFLNRLASPRQRLPLMGSQPVASAGTFDARAASWIPKYCV